MTEDLDKTRFDYYRKAKSHEAKGEYEEALAAFTSAIELADDYAHAWFYKGKLHYKLGQYKDAVCCAERALELEPTWESHIVRILRDAKEKI
ncbi:MAG: tetratricopeptide repeat protein [Candidatus Thorarchaeota archaeon]